MRGLVINTDGFGIDINTAGGGQYDRGELHLASRTPPARSTAP